MATGYKLQFSLRSLLFLVALSAFLFWTGNFIRYHYFQRPHHPRLQLASTTDLQEAIEELNKQVDQFALPSKLKLSESEIINAMKCDNLLPDEWYSSEVARKATATKLDAVCQQISATHKLPTGTVLEIQRGGTVTMTVRFDSIPPAATRLS